MSTWSPVGRPVWEGLGGVRLGTVSEISKTHGILSVLPASCLGFEMRALGAPATILDSTLFVTVGLIKCSLSEVALAMLFYYSNRKPLYPPRRISLF